MKKILLSLAILCLVFSVNAQRLLSWTPEFPVDNSTLSFTVDCNKGNQGLLNFEGGNSANVYVHVGVITNLSTGPTDWKYVKFTWGSTDPLANATSLGANKYQYTINNIRTFFGVPAGEIIKKVTVIFRNATGSLKQVNSDVSDMYLPVYGSAEYGVRLNLPPFEPRYIPWVEPINVAVGGSISITGVASANSNLTLKLDGTNINTAANANTISANPTIATACTHQVFLEGNNGSTTVKDSFSFYIAPATNVAPLPSGVIEGLNYNPNNTAVTLVLFAPGKNNVVAIGDFSGWANQCTYQMNKTPDGNYFWITLTGLTPGQEYGYQYLVDNTIRTADPYTQKVLDPDDQFINATTYPGLKPYPTGLTTGQVGIIQTAEPQYNWQVNNFVKPDKKNLVVYELLIRDFTAEHSYQSLIDSLLYLKNIGINAIELMPINEFDGNESWGYNPSFYFAPDKYYGTKNKLKEFIDKCHQNGIAVILDVVYNHCTGNAPQAKMYWDAANNRPAPNNPWLNPTAPHAYAFFNDFNHTSTATQYLTQRSLNHWLSEYKIDGYRFDLAKGFTQTSSNTTTIENYDASRVANLKRYYDGTLPTYPGTYMILEFLGTLPSQEEQEYAAHGFMLWGNSNFTYNQCTMGFVATSDISAISYNSPQRGFNNPAVMGYMESHDEERNMYKNITFGNSAGSYNVRNLNTALARVEAAATVFFTVPGPKMIWQFGERGYDIPLTFGGSNVANKPPHWEYMLVPERVHLYNTYKSIIQLRLSNPAVFNNTSFTYDFNSGLVKVFQIADPNAAGKKVTVVANFDVVAQTKTVTFQSAGDWTNYISNGTGTALNGITGSNFNLTATSQSITLQPGEYHIYVSVPACATALPAATSPVNYCQNATASPLQATGTNLLWYTTATGGTGSPTAPTPSTTTIGSTTYYVTQTIGSCESARLPIVVNVTANTPAPTVTSPVNYCQNGAAVQLTATGTSLLWYTTATGGTGSSTAPTPSTTTIGSISYYVSQTQSCGESPRAVIVVNVSAVPAAPGVTSPLTYCQNVTAPALTATGTNLLWYTVATGGTGNATPPIPSTATAGSTAWYVSQSNNGCESPRASITVNVNAAPGIPTVTTPVTYCQNAAAVPLTATGTALLWYTTATGGTGVATAPTPSTATAGSTNYYVTQTISGCESQRAVIAVNITGLPAAPTATTPVTYCQNVTATALTATGTNLTWYTTATGGTGSATAPTPITTTAGSTSYYVSQTNNCGEGPRAAINVNVTATPAAPTGLNVTGITTNSAVLNWNVTAGNFYSVDYRVSGSGAWVTAAASITAGSVSVSNLTQSTFYDWRVNANCAATPANNYATAQFSTLAHNNQITNLKNGYGIKISPNPVTGNALIDYIIADNGRVSIEVFNPQGQRVQTLLNTSQIRGQYQISVTSQLSMLAKGVYILELKQHGRGNVVKFVKY
ncbi:MAG: fibronectin type III domain-containing protein [Chitinophagaceae bacterium]|nr:fibronectin type III domain-containing protein [Chitinophagaceae bacterium]